MPNREDVKAKAQRFLEALAQKFRGAPGANLKVVQQAVWWSPTGTGDSGAIVHSKAPVHTLRSSGHEREVFNSAGVSMFYQVSLIDNGFAEQSELYNVLVAADIQAQWIRYGFLLPLVAAWCKLPDPFDMNQPSARGLLDEFAEDVIDKTSSTRYRDIILSLDMGGTAIILEEGVVLRPINDEELWDFGSGTFSSPPFSLQLSPSTNWCILDIQIKRQLDYSNSISTELYALRDAVVATLALTAVTSFTLVPIGMTAKFVLELELDPPSQNERTAHSHAKKSTD